MKTSQKQIFRDGEDALMFSREDFHVSRSALQERERGRKITATSGRKCYEQYGRYSPLGSLVKMLLVSSQWFSPARRLKWDMQTICSTRISYTERNSNSQSMPSVKTLNVQDIQSNRLLFRLVPSEHPTEETGYGLLPTVQTQGLKICNKEGKTEFLKPFLLPTPNASEGTKWTTTYNASSQMGKGLTAMACSGLLLTPMAKDGMRSGMTMDALKKHGEAKANLAEQIAHKVGGGTSQLNPLFVEEMMGYPLEWLTLPFLSQSGEAKALKH